MKITQDTNVKNRPSLCLNSGNVPDEHRRVSWGPNWTALPVFLTTPLWRILGCLLERGLKDYTIKLSEYTEKPQLLKIPGELHSNTSSFFYLQNYNSLTPRWPTKKYLRDESNSKKVLAYLNHSTFRCLDLDINPLFLLLKCVLLFL